MALILTSPAFNSGQRIPKRFTRDGENISPPLIWNGIPDQTQSLILVLDDPDAPGETFGHWAVFNMGPHVNRLAEGAGGKENIADLQQGTNDFGDDCYDGPEPPIGHGIHHYHFRLAALNVLKLSVPAQVGVVALWRQARMHAIEQAELIGTYERSA